MAEKVSREILKDRCKEAARLANQAFAERGQDHLFEARAVGLTLIVKKKGEQSVE